MKDFFSSHQIKAVFLDYTGTMVREDEPYTMELLKYFLTHSDLKEPAKALQVVWGMIKQIEYDCYQETFIKKDEMVERILAACVKDYGLKGDLAYMHEIWRKSWIHAPLFDDVEPFFEKCPLLIYVVTNDDLCYIEESLAEKGLKPAGIAAAEMVRACKPHREIFEKALEMAGVDASQAVHIGDSIVSDVEAAKAVSITPILLDRKGGRTGEDVTVIRSLTELVQE